MFWLIIDHVLLINDRVQIDQVGSNISTMQYDGDGLRRVLEEGLVRTTFVWDGDDYLGEVR